MIKKINAFFLNTEGAETAEWAVIVSLLIVIGITAYGVISGGLLSAVATLAIGIQNVFAG